MDKFEEKRKMTPTKTEIERHARELYVQECYRSGHPELAETNPTRQELSESGFIQEAQSELMRSEGYEYELYLKEAKERARCKTYLDHDISKGKLPLDFNECKRSNILISGTNQVGKSLAAMGISHLLRSKGWQILVFDNCGHWREKSSISKSYVVKKKKDRIVMHVGESMIFDVSLLLPRDQKRFLEQMLEQVWKFRVLQKPKQWCLIVLEEAHLYMRNIRGLASQSLMRMCSVGANWRIRTLAISPSLTGLDTEFIRLCGQRFHFRLGIELNAERRFRAYYGLDWTRIAKTLDVGYCIYLDRAKLEVWKIPMFQREKLKVTA